MQIKTKNRIKDYLAEAAPTIIISGLASVAVVVLYNKYLVGSHLAYEEYLDNKAALFAEALDTTTDAILEKIKES